MDVSFSLPQWRANQLQNIDLKLQQQFYASTPYNLDDFKQTYRPPVHIFVPFINKQAQLTTKNRNNNSAIKQLLYKQNVSLGIFVAFIYEFISKIIRQTQKSYKQNKQIQFYNQMKNNNNLLKIESQIKNRLSSSIDNKYKISQFNQKESQRRIIHDTINNNYENINHNDFNQDNINDNDNSHNSKIQNNNLNNNKKKKNNNNLNSHNNKISNNNNVYSHNTNFKSFNTTQQQQYTVQQQSLKQLKLKIYDLDLCILQQIPQKYLKYYQNNLLKKLIFQYLTKVLHNISLIEILLMNNDLLCFALSLISKVLYKGKQNQNNQQRKTSNIQNNQTNKGSIQSLEINPTIKFNSRLQFTQEIRSFLQYFDGYPAPESNYHDNNSIIPTNDKDYSYKRFELFSLYENEMRSKHVVFKRSKNNQYLLYLNKFQSSIVNVNRMNINTIDRIKIIDKMESMNNMNKMENKNNIKKSKTQSKLKSKMTLQQNTSRKTNSSKKVVNSLEQLKLLASKNKKKIDKQSEWMQYLCCLRYFFTDSKQLNRIH